MAMSKFRQKLEQQKKLLEFPSPPPLPPVEEKVIRDPKNKTRALTEFGEVSVGEAKHMIHAEELEEIKYIGRGQFGSVVKMRHSKFDEVFFAVKRIHLNTQVSDKEQSRWENEVDILKKSTECPFIVSYYGALVYEGDMWILMELMNRSLDKLIELIYKTLKTDMPNPALMRIAYSIVSALHYLKENVAVLHRDIKPSNILINRDGEIKMCDFGISGILQGSYCSTTVGCARYLAPERIDIAPDQPPPKYDSRSDTWSFGLTMFELAVGRSPYPDFENPFQRITCIVDGNAPRIEDSPLSQDCKDFVHFCLEKDVNNRPRYQELLKHPFLAAVEKDDFDMSVWYHGVLEEEEKLKSKHETL